jgi:cytochrome bd ubiquinol oxidase subunit II
MGVSVSVILWLLIMLFSLAVYTMLDGYDLGIGMLLLTERDHHRRHTMMEIVATALDGNEIWLVMVGTGFFAAFPHAYSTFASGLYIPIIIMIISLGFRGVAIEMQGKAESYQHRWGVTFFVGSLIATICQGLALGTILTGIPLTASGAPASQISYLNGYTILFAVFYVAACCLMGANWLNNKGKDAIETSSKQKARILTPIVVVLFLAVAIVALLVSPVLNMYDTTFKVAAVIGMIVLAVAASVIGFFTINLKGSLAPFFFSVIPLAFALLIMAIINYPYLLPPSITIAQAAAPASTFQFLLIGEGVFIPIVVAYQFFANFVFRGKFTLHAEKTADSRKMA